MCGWNWNYEFFCEKPHTATVTSGSKCETKRSLNKKEDDRRLFIFFSSACLPSLTTSPYLCTVASTLGRGCTAENDLLQLSASQRERERDIKRQRERQRKRVQRNESLREAHFGNRLTQLRQSAFFFLSFSLLHLCDIGLYLRRAAEKRSNPYMQWPFTRNRRAQNTKLKNNIYFLKKKMTPK